MAEQTSRKREYREAQSAFDRLRVDEKAIFLVEATLSTVARGIEDVGRTLADELDSLFQQEHEPTRSEEEAEGASAADGPSAAEAASKESSPEESTTDKEDDAGA